MSPPNTQKVERRAIRAIRSRNSNAIRPVATEPKPMPSWPIPTEERRRGARKKGYQNIQETGLWGPVGTHRINAKKQETLR